MIKGRTFVYFFNFVGNSTLFGRWHTRVIALVLLIIAMVFMYPQAYPSDTLPVIWEEEVFIGREDEVQLLTNWIENSTVSTISIVGSPGFGKSTLAIHVGHEITEKGGIAVHYADLYEVVDVTTLNEKMTDLVLGEKRQSSEDLFRWASKLRVPTLLIFDNCDELLYKHKDAFQNLVKKLLRKSQCLKVMFTAKQMISFLVSFKNFTLRELTSESAANVLLKLSNSLNRTMALEIAGLVGNVPLALQVVGSLLKDINPSTIANDLRRDPIPALSSELLLSTERVFTSLNISYHYLSPEHQKCGRLLALFPGSFNESAVRGILGRELVQDPSKCLRELQYKSLLSYDTHTQRYRYHQLIREFFAYISNEYEDSKQLNKTFVSHFANYFAGSGSSCEDELRKLYDSIDAERPNFDFLISHSLESCPSYAGPVMESLAGLVFNLTNGVLHLCKFLHSRQKLFKLFQRLQNMDSWLDTITRNLDRKDPLQHPAQTLLKQNKDILHDFTKLTDTSSITKALSRSTKDLKNILQGLSGKNPLRHLVQTMLRLNEDETLLFSYIHRGDIYGAILVGIDIGKEGLVHFDANFKGISMHTGTSAYLEMYVNLLAELSKLEAIIHGRQKPLETLMLRYDWITELFPTNDLESQWIKYHSALAHNYILLGQFDNFLEHWKEILQLKYPLAQCVQQGCTSIHLWSLTQCKQAHCTPIDLALAHFGQGDYEQSAKQMEALLKSKSLRGNRRVRLFILLHECYIGLGNAKKAAQLLTKDHYLSRFPSIRTIKATDYVNNSTNLLVVYHRYQHDHSIAWLLNRECMTISSQNYRTCFILASFYRSLGSRDATKLGRVLHHVLRHHIERYIFLFEMQWRDYEVYSGDLYSRSNFGGLPTVILFFVGIFLVAILGCIVILRL